MIDLASQNVISFVGRHAIVDVHYHQCYQIVASLDMPFNSTINQVNYPGLNGFIVNQDIPHCCQAQDTEVLVYFIDPESAQGRQLKEMLGDKPYIPVESILGAGGLADIIRPYAPGSSVDELRLIADDLLQAIVPFDPEPEHRLFDERIEKVLDYIDDRLDEPMTLKDISSAVFLSPERIRHLFAKETGISFSQYVLWKRIKLVLTEVIKDNVPMVDSAIQNGFTDQAHFSRLFKRTFGVPAGQMLKNSRFVQFLTPEL